MTMVTHHRYNYHYSLQILLVITTILTLHLSTTTNAFSTPTTSPNIKSFHIGAGCFWAPADKLRNLDGILSTTVGYCGDNEYNNSSDNNKLPSYETVCSGRTKLVEAVRVEYDANVLGYQDMLQLYKEVNTAQGGNKRQYAGVIFTGSEEEANQANSFLQQQNNEDSLAVVATVEPMSTVFYSAEGYHQNYWSKWRTRVVAVVVTIVAVGYFDNAELIDPLISQKVWNYICYALIGFSLLERRIDVGKDKIVVGSITED